MLIIILLVLVFNIYIQGTISMALVRMSFSWFFGQGGKYNFATWNASKNLIVYINYNKLFVSKTRFQKS
jgi:hypothetical protein